jgi:hypothetical protein
MCYLGVFSTDRTLNPDDRWALGKPHSLLEQGDHAQFLEPETLPTVLVVTEAAGAKNTHFSGIPGSCGQLNLIY